MRTPYPSHLTDEQRQILKLLIPVPEVGRPRTHDPREILNAILDLHRSGGQSDLRPHDRPPTSTVYRHVAPGRGDGTWQTILDAPRQRVRTAVGKQPSPSAARIPLLVDGASFPRQEDLPPSLQKSLPGNKVQRSGRRVTP